MHVGESESLSMQLRVYVKGQIKAERRGSRKSSFSAKRRDKVFIILSLHKSSFPWISKNKTNTVILCMMFLLSKAKWISSECWWSPTRPWRSPCCTISQNQGLIQYLLSFKSHCPCYFFSKKMLLRIRIPAAPHPLLWALRQESLLGLKPPGTMPLLQVRIITIIIIIIICIIINILLLCIGEHWTPCKKLQFFFEKQTHISWRESRKMVCQNFMDELWYEWLHDLKNRDGWMYGVSQNIVYWLIYELANGPERWLTGTGQQSSLWFDWNWV